MIVVYTYSSYTSYTCISIVRHLYNLLLHHLILPRSTREVLMQRCKAVENPAIVPQMSKKMTQNIPGTPQVLQVMSYPDWYLQVLRDAADEARNAEKRIQLTSTVPSSLSAAGIAHNSGICWQSSWRLATTSMAIRVQSRTIFLQSGRRGMSKPCSLYMSIRDYTFIGM